MIAVIVAIITSFIGSMGALLLWIHFDLDERWRRWSIRRGERIERKRNPRLRDDNR